MDVPELLQSLAFSSSWVEAGKIVNSCCHRFWSVLPPAINSDCSIQSLQYHIHRRLEVLLNTFLPNSMSKSVVFEVLSTRDSDWSHIVTVSEKDRQLHDLDVIKTGPKAFRSETHFYLFDFTSSSIDGSPSTIVRKMNALHCQQGGLVNLSRERLKIAKVEFVILSCEATKLTDSPSFEMLWTSKVKHCPLTIGMVEAVDSWYDASRIISSKLRSSAPFWTYDRLTQCVLWMEVLQELGCPNIG